MNHDLICSWLGLPPGGWPPDHYRLLGLRPGEDNAELIEQRVHQRLDSVRRYQMMHPEQATEAMNRLAQAFVCLMEPASKRVYDSALPDAVSPVAEPTPSAPTGEPTTLSWLDNPPPVVVPIEPAPLTIDPVESAPMAIPLGPPPPPPATTVSYATALPPPIRQPPPLPPRGESGPVLEPRPSPPVATIVHAPATESVDTVIEAAQSGAARRGIGTKRALYYRIARTRQLLRVWTSLGKYLSSPKRRLNRGTEGPDFVRHLEETAALLKGFPPLLGEAGQPGYLVLALTLVDTVKVFQSFSPHQREALTRDWRAGVKLLLAHRDFLRHELRAMRKRTLRQRLARGAFSLIIDQPGTVLLLLALLAINIALWRTYAEALWEKIVSP